MIIGRRIIRLPVTTSTMDEIDRLASDGEAEGLVVVADRQTKGRGRSGRTWESAPGQDLLLSILLRPRKTASEITVFPLVTGLAVARAIDEVAGVTTSLKWPNDILIRDKKLAGILMTSRLTRDAIEHLNIGIGINVAGTPSNVPKGGTTLAAESAIVIERDTLLRAVLSRLDDSYSAFCTARAEPFVQEWTQKAAFLNERVVIRSGNEIIEGVFRGADGHGALLLERDDGSVDRIVAGELVRGPRRVTANSERMAF